MVVLSNYFGLQGVKQLNFKGVASPPVPNYPNLAPLEQDTFVKSAETVKKERKSEDGLRVVDEFDSKTGKMLKTTAYFKDGKTPEIIGEYDSVTGNKMKDTWLYEDGKTIRWIHEYDSSKVDFETKAIRFKEDGKKIDVIDEFDPQTGKRAKTIWFNDEGNAIERVDELSPSNEFITVKSTLYKEDGKTIKEVISFDPKTGEKIKTNG